MSAKPPALRPEVARVLEKQMRNWELARAQRPASPSAPPTAQVQEFVAVSRMVGAGGREFAQALSERLHWPVFDQEILRAMAGDDRVRARLYEYMDERDLGWLEDTLRRLLAGDFRPDDYFHRLSEAILAIARQGRAIFLGRGADLILPRDRGLRVRLVAPLEDRVQAFAQRHNLSEALARAAIERVEQERLEFLRRHFGKAAELPTRHDLIINRLRFTLPEAADLVCYALRTRGVIA